MCVFFQQTRLYALYGMSVSNSALRQLRQFRQLEVLQNPGDEGVRHTASAAGRAVSCFLRALHYLLKLVCATYCDHLP